MPQRGEKDDEETHRVKKEMCKPQMDESLYSKPTAFHLTLTPRSGKKTEHCREEVGAARNPKAAGRPGVN